MIAVRVFSSVETIEVALAKAGRFCEITLGRVDLQQQYRRSLHKSTRACAKACAGQMAMSAPAIFHPESSTNAVIANPASMSAIKTPMMIGDLRFSRQHIAHAIVGPYKTRLS